MLEFLETSALGVWVRESPTVWALPTVLTVHTTGMAVLVGVSWVLDLRLLGIIRNVPLSSFRWTFPVLAFGLALNLATGIMLFIQKATTWGTSVPFFIKMGLVVAGVATLWPVRSLLLREGAQEDAGGSARMLAVASIVAWTGAVTAGRLLAYMVP